MDTVIIVANLLNAPSEKLAVHWLTTQIRLKERLTVLVEAEDYAKDIYYHFMRQSGLMDGVNGIVTPSEKVEAVRIDTHLDFPSTILVKSISSRNMMKLWKQIHSMTDMHCIIQDKYKRRSICDVAGLANVKLV